MNKLLLSAFLFVAASVYGAPTSVQYPGNVVAAGFIGSGAGLSNITAASVSVSTTVSNGTASALATTLVSGESPPVFMPGSNTAFAGNAAYLTNMPPNGEVWSHMPVPPLMYSTFMSYGCNNSEATVLALLLNIKTNGLWDAGWRYFMVEDGQYSNSRDAGGNLTNDIVRFPHGFPFIVDVAHTNGFSIGSYVSMGPVSCCTGFNPGSPIDKLWRDIVQQRIWGFDGITLDDCGWGPSDITYSRIINGLRTFRSAAFDSGAVLANDGALSLNRGMWLVMNTTDDFNGVVPWEAIYGANVFATRGYGHLGFDYLTCNQSNYLAVARHLLAYRDLWGPGHAAYAPSFNPYQAEGMGTMKQLLDTLVMCCAWVNMGPGPNNNLSRDLFNTEVLGGGILQDPAVIPATVVYSNSLASVWRRPLGSSASGTNVVLLINEAPTNQTITVTSSMLPGTAVNSDLTIRDPWNHVTVSNCVGGFSWTVGPTNMVLLKVYPTSYGPVIEASDFVPSGPSYPAATWVLYSPRNSLSNSLHAAFNGGGTNMVSDVPLLTVGTFDPRTVSGLQIWYDAASMGLSVGQTNSFTDLTANHINATAAAGVAYDAPYFTNNQSLLNVGWMQFTTSDGLSTPILTPVAQPFTLFLVSTVPSDGPVLFGTAYLGDATNNTAVYGSAGNLHFSSDSVTWLDQPVTLDTKFYVLEIEVNGVSTKIWTNGVLGVTGDAGAAHWAGISLNMNKGGTQKSTSGIAAVLVYTNAISGQDSTNINQMLLERFFGTGTSAYTPTLGGPTLDVIGGSITANRGYWLPTNTVSVTAPPSTATTPGGAFFWNSNGTVYLMTSSPGSTTWGKTNKLGP